MTYLDYLSTPIGTLEISASEKGITRIVYIEAEHQTIHASPVIDNCKQQLTEYFTGDRKSFTVSLDTQGTDFQESVWQQLKAVPYGETCSYSDIANKLKNPKAVRAVGTANGRNPISIIVPCHRVIGSDGSLTGYAWGVDRKQWLLEHEKA